MECNKYKKAVTERKQLLLVDLQLKRFESAKKLGLSPFLISKSCIAVVRAAAELILMQTACSQQLQDPIGLLPPILLGQLLPLLKRQQIG